MHKKGAVNQEVFRSIDIPYLLGPPFPETKVQTIV